jgi:hypothetical protein
VRNEDAKDDESVKLNNKNILFKDKKKNKKNKQNDKNKGDGKKNNGSDEDINNSNKIYDDFFYVDEREKERWEKIKKQKKEWDKIVKELKNESVEEEVL